VIALSAHEVATALGIEAGGGTVRGVSTDSRTLRPGDLFVALRGTSYDGHAFVPAAFAAGASGAVVELGAAIAGDSDWQPPGSGHLLRVPDTVQALAGLARTARRKSGATVIAVTGSVGKTGTKDLLRAMAGSIRRVSATAANENNEIGVPLTLLRADPDAQVIVLEMGMRGPGQIAELAAIAEPDVGLITAIAPVHLELLGTLDDVARAKMELLFALREGGVGVIPAGVPALDGLAAETGRRMVRFSLGDAPEADVKGIVYGPAGARRRLELRWPDGSLELEAPFSARHRLENAVAAAAACYAAGLPLDRCVPGLQQTEFTPSRGDEIEVGSWLVLDDSYNANPAAMRLALDTLVERAAERRGRAIAVLGDMLELGPEAERYHREVGRYAAEVGVSGLWAYGPLSQATVEGFWQGLARPRPVEPQPSGIASESGEFMRTAAYLANLEAEVLTLKSTLRPGDTILVKGSRGMRLERVVAQLVGSAVRAEG
jgi:UDP-N-acetylmuramoyl-tripeptide--D-alanyl-D-alanine ligase